MSKEAFDSMMKNGLEQAKKDESMNVDEFFEKLGSEN